METQSALDDVSYSLEEYKMLRTEILQYLEEYQNVRNMMYVVTGAILAFGIGSDEIYLLLLPLVVIVPSYKIAIEYTNNVIKTASYLRIFYEEKYKTFPIRWETRLRKTNSLSKKKHAAKHITSGNLQLLPYWVLMVTCHGLYFVRYIESNMDTWVVLMKTEFMNAGDFAGVVANFLQLLLGTITAMICFYNVRKSAVISAEEYDDIWRQVQKTEMIK